MAKIQMIETGEKHLQNELKNSLSNQKDSNDMRLISNPPNSFKPTSEDAIPNRTKKKGKHSQAHAEILDFENNLYQ